MTFVDIGWQVDTSADFLVALIGGDGMQKQKIIYEKTRRIIINNKHAVFYLASKKCSFTHF